MKIKEAAQICSLTEKAIRLYESKGLIHPKTEERNGRTFRDYDEDTVRTLMTVGTLRRAAFSIEQIGIMQASPKRIPEIFAQYREDVRENAAQLIMLSHAVDAIGTEEALSIDQLAEHLAAAMLPEETTPAISDDITEACEPSAEALSVPTAIRCRFAVWDEDIKQDEKEAAYQAFLKKQERRERLLAISLWLPRKISAAWGRIPKAARRKLIMTTVVCILTVIALYNIVWITPYKITLEGVEYTRGNPDPTHVTPVSITFDGKLYQYLFKKDYFVGAIDIEGYTAKSSFPSKNVEPNYTTDRLYYKDFPTRLSADSAILDFYKGENDHYRIDSNFIFLENFEDTESMLAVFPVMESTGDPTNHSWSSADGAYIVAPAATRDDAEYIVRKFWERHNLKYRPDEPIK